MPLMYDLGPQAPLDINGGTVQNCQIINNYSDILSIITMSDGTLFGNLIAFNTVGYEKNDPFLANWGAVVAMFGQAFVINNTIVNNESAEYGIDVYGPSFIVNNIIFNSYPIYMCGSFAEVIKNNALKDYSIEDNEDGNVNIKDNVDLGEEDIFVKKPEEEGYQEEGLPEFDFTPKDNYTSIVGNGLDVFFDTVPEDMNGTSRTRGKAVDIGAHQHKGGDSTEPVYPSGEVVYVKKDGNDAAKGTSWSEAMKTPELAVTLAARGKVKNVYIAGGVYDVEGRVVLYTQKDRFSGGIWSGILLSEGMSILGGFKGTETGSAEQQKNARPYSGNEAWNFGEHNTVLKGHYGNMVNMDALNYNDGELGFAPFGIGGGDEEAGMYESFNPDYLALWEPLHSETADKAYTTLSSGVRVVGQVEDFDQETVVDGVEIKNGYTICDMKVRISDPGVKRFNHVGGAGAHIMVNGIMRNSKIDNCYESTLYLPQQFLNFNVCGGGIMIVGGKLLNSMVNNNIAETSGGGVFIARGLVENTVISDNHAFSAGGGIITSHTGSALGSTTINHCTIKNNEALGIYPPTTDIYGGDSVPGPNDALGLGGGAWIANNVIVDGSIFEGNKSKSGGNDIYVATKDPEKPQAVVQNSLIINNDFAINQAILMEHGSLLHSNIINNKNPIGVVAGSESKPKVAGSIFWNNENAPQEGMNMTYSALNGGYGAAEAMNMDLSADNNAVNGPRFVNPAEGDFHLLESSALIDKVADLGIYWDFEGNERPQGKLADMGMYEFVKSLKSLKSLGLPTGDKFNYVTAVSGLTVIMIISLGIFHEIRKRKPKNGVI